VLAGLLAACLLLMPAMLPEPAVAQSIDQGIDFLAASQRAGGGWSSSEVRSLHATTEALRALQTIGVEAASRSAAADLLELEPVVDNDDRARRLEVLALEGRSSTALAADLLAAGDSAGGWGLISDFTANPLDTALALTALARSGQSGSREVFTSLVTLVGAQNADGGWPCVASGESETSCTAHALSTLSLYRSLFLLETPIAKGIAFLRAEIQPDGSIGSFGAPLYTTAVASRALLAVGDELSGNRSQVRSFLQEAQGADGSWEGDPFLTAVALRALQAFVTTPFCGDGVVNTTRESCDGSDLAATTCEDVGFGPGTLVCDSACTFDTDGCGPPPVCGDGEINQVTEACDGSTLAGETCESLGFGSGDLACSERCTFDTESCLIQPKCGDGLVNQDSEACDGLDLGGKSCTLLGLGDGVLACRSNCRLDASGCSAIPVCGDGVANLPVERCDAPDLAGESCESFGGAEGAGSLACLDDCTNFEISGCTDLPDADGDGFPAGADCDDFDPEVNPGQEEVALNLKDDDCDLRTTDVLAECGVEVVFTMDTSGSMNDDAAALCSRISQVKTDLFALGIDAKTHLLGIAGIRGGAFSCLTDHVRRLLGGVVPGDDGRCDGFLNHGESWGQATAIVADRFSWIPGFIRVIVPISDEGPCNGNPCFVDHSDRDAIANGANLALANEIFVSPIVARGGNQCVSTLATFAATETGGEVFFSTNPDLDLASAIANLVTGACQGTLLVEVDPALAVNPPGTSHALTATVTDSLGMPREGAQVTVGIVSGPNASELGPTVTGPDGSAVFDYTSDGTAGPDQIVASITDSLGRTVESVSALKFWDEDCNDNGVADTCDLDCGGFDSACGVFAECGRSADVNEDGSPDECLLPSAGIDEDGDGFPTNLDCDDQEGGVNPGATEIPGNGVDDDCNPGTPDDVAGLVACTLLTDQVAYGASEAIVLELRVESAATEETLTGLGLELRVTAKGGAVIAEEERTLAPLAPGELRVLELETSTGITPPGALSTRVEVTAGSSVAASCSAQAEILSSLERGLLLTGSVEAAPDEILAGDLATILFGVTNAGNVDLEPAAFEILVVDPPTEEVLFQLPGTVALAVGESLEDQRSMPKLPVGDYLIVLRGGAGEADRTLATTGFRVINTPPDCIEAVAVPDPVWPPAHKFVDVEIQGVTDADSDEVTLTVLKVLQNEPTEGTGDGATCPDAVGLGSSTASVRMERSGDGDGRVYHVVFEADDGRGGTCEGEVTVCVPHDEGAGATCGDQGDLFDSMVCR